MADGTALIPPAPLVPPAAAADAAERARVLGQGSTEPLSAAGVEVSEALTGRRPLAPEHVAAMSDHPYPLDSLNGLLFGGAAGRSWARALAARTAAARPPRDLAEFSANLNAVNRRFRDRVEVVLAQAMRTALSRADRKVNVRARRRQVTASALAPHVEAWAARCYPTAFLAAIATTPDELLHEAFTDAADQIDGLFRRRQAERRRLLARTFPDDLDADTLALSWQQEEDRRSGAIVAFVAAAMFAEASARLTLPRTADVFDPRGERPADPFSSPRITADVGRLADGASLTPGSGAAAPPSAAGGAGTGRGLPAGPTPAGTPTVPEVPAPVNAPGADPTAEGGPLFDYTDALIDDVLAEVAPGTAVTYVWTVGSPANPFWPHQNLEGMTATNETFWMVFTKDPDEFPEGELAWFPGDHGGCQCDLDVIYTEPD